MHCQSWLLSCTVHHRPLARQSVSGGTLAGAAVAQPAPHPGRPRSQCSQCRRPSTYTNVCTSIVEFCPGKTAVGHPKTADRRSRAQTRRRYLAGAPRSGLPQQSSTLWQCSLLRLADGAKSLVNVFCASSVVPSVHHPVPSSFRNPSARLDAARIFAPAALEARTAVSTDLRTGDYLWFTARNPPAPCLPAAPRWRPRFQCAVHRARRGRTCWC
jgi:hypothetical protein